MGPSLFQLSAGWQVLWLEENFSFVSKFIKLNIISQNLLRNLPREQIFVLYNVTKIYEESSIFETHFMNHIFEFSESLPLLDFLSTLHYTSD